MKIPFSTFEHMHRDIKNEMLTIFEKTYDAGWFIQGKEYTMFEQEYAKFCDTKYCVGVGNGLDAIFLSLKALGIGKGDEVIIPSHTFIATALAVVYAGAKPIFCEVDLDTYLIDISKIESKITKKNKAIIVVHLYGQMANMEQVAALANDHGIYVIEDAAQSHGSSYKGKKSGSWGQVGCFSFYPGKNLGALGDAGAVVTNNLAIFNKLHSLSCYGSSQKYKHDLMGVNSRLDEVQAAFLRIKLAYLEQWNDERRVIAQRYMTGIKNSKITLPVEVPDSKHVWHLFVIRTKDRDDLKKYLEEKEIGALIHYPIPMHLQEAFSSYGYKKGDFPIAELISETVLSLPLYIGMKDEEIDYVIDVLNLY